MRLILTFLCLFLIREQCFVDVHELRAPVLTTLENFPFQVAVHGEWTCSGALITDTYVITSAHCLNKSSVSVDLGLTKYPGYASNLKEENHLFFKSGDIIFHEEFIQISESFFLNDVELIKLPKPVTANEKIRPGKFFPREKAHLLEEQFANLSGWIASEDISLQFETVRLLNQDTCSYFFGSDFLKTQEMCAKVASSTWLTLAGDVLTIDGKIVGLLARKHHCKKTKSTCELVIVFQNLIPYLSWISDKVNVPIDELTGESNEEISDLTLKKVEATMSVIREMRGKLEKDLAKVSEKVEKIINGPKQK